MANFRFKQIIVLIFLSILLPLTITNCTSSDSDTSVLEGELENIDGSDASETMADDIEDLADIAEEDLEDVVDQEDDFGGDELAELDDDEQEPDEFSDDELDNEGEDEFAENDDEFDEFDEFDEEGGEKKEFAQNEEALAQEMNKMDGNQDYPVVENAQPQFPEEVMGQQDPSQGAVASNPVPPPGPLITSETQEITLPEDPIEPTLPQDDLGQADPIVPPDDYDEPATQSWIPVVKIKTDPFFRNQRLMNAVYIVRPDDSMDSISQKIFGANRVSELNADNVHLAKGIDPGDKVYYNSPNRTEDKSQLKVYYEDIGLQAQYYKTQKNDNMRRLGSKLLGFADGWKELWAINFNVN